MLNSQPRLETLCLSSRLLYRLLLGRCSRLLGGVAFFAVDVVFAFTFPAGAPFAFVGAFLAVAFFFVRPNTAIFTTSLALTATSTMALPILERSRFLLLRFFFMVAAYSRQVWHLSARNAESHNKPTQPTARLVHQSLNHNLSAVVRK
jgi:hypothetical protein